MRRARRVLRNSRIPACRSEASPAATRQRRRCVARAGGRSEPAATADACAIRTRPSLTRPDQTRIILFLVALGRVLDGVANFFKLFAGLLDRVVHRLAGLLGGAGLLTTGQSEAEQHCCDNGAGCESVLGLHRYASIRGCVAP